MAALPKRPRHRRIKPKPLPYRLMAHHASEAIEALFKSAHVVACGDGSVVVRYSAEAFDDAMAAMDLNADQEPLEDAEPDSDGEPWLGWTLAGAFGCLQDRENDQTDDGDGVDVPHRGWTPREPVTLADGTGKPAAEIDTHGVLRLKSEAIVN